MVLGGQMHGVCEKKYATKAPAALPWALGVAEIAAGMDVIRARSQPQFKKPTVL
jgi:hypothetical protein